MRREESKQRVEEIGRKESDGEGRTLKVESGKRKHGSESGECAHAFHILRDLFGVAAFGALKEHVLDEMGGAAEPRGFAPASHGHPDAEAHARHVRHLSGYDGYATRMF